MNKIAKGFVYIITSEKSGKHYLGSTIDPENRLHEHNSGENRSTKNKGPWFHSAIIEFSTIVNARKTEQWLKRIHRKEIIEKIIKKDFTWPDNSGMIRYIEVG